MQTEPVRLNIGAGDQEKPGYVSIDAKTGGKAYPLAYPDDCAEEIYASHILEHFGHGFTLLVLRDWVRVLKPGGLLRVAVPDFDHIVKAYEEGSDEWYEGYLMGGQTDANDAHHAIFNERKLRELLTAVGLVDINPWVSNSSDCAALPVSLNLQGRKPVEASQPAPAPTPTVAGPNDLPLRIAACMSVPRLGFMDNFFCAMQALLPLRIVLRKTTGAFWGQCLERCISEALTDQPAPDAILTMDYDTIFTKADVCELVRLLAEHPEVDAIAPMQSSRTQGLPMMTIMGPEGNLQTVERGTFAGDLTEVATAHFGLTLIRRSVFECLPHPWFWSKPDLTGHWTDARTDDDIYFWRQMAAHGLKLSQANRVVIGHAELMVLWPDEHMRTIYQSPVDFFGKGKPVEVWK